MQGELARVWSDADELEHLGMHVGGARAKVLGAQGEELLAEMAEPALRLLRMSPGHM